MMFGSNRSSKFRDVHNVAVFLAENQLERVESFKHLAHVPMDCLGITIHQHMK